MHIIFVCQFGGAKSVIAANLFNREAAKRGRDWTASAASAEEPYDAVPVPVVDLLRADGIDVSAFRPRRLERADLEEASRVISIDCSTDVPDVERWDDVPKVSDGVQESAAAIRKHVNALIEELDV